MLGITEYIKRCKLCYTFRAAEEGGGRESGWCWTEWSSGPTYRGDGVEPMRSHEARPGIVVRVYKSYRKPEFEGMLGTIKNCYGDPEYPALDVQLEDGRLELFWFHQLEKIEECSPAV